jgi:hypothetical protein
LINQSGNLFVRGEYAEAANVGESSVRCIAHLSDRLRLAEPYKALNNYAIAAFRAGRCSASDSIDLLEPMAKSLGEAGRRDHSLLSINIGGLKFLAGHVEEADALFQSTYAGLKEDSADGYYLIYAAANWAVTRAFLGAEAHARALLDEVDDNLADVFTEFLRAFKLRQEAMRTAISEQSSLSTEAWDAYPQSIFGPEGPHVSWRSIGRGILMSDIQVWSES